MNIDKCRLCQKECVELKQSHIIPKMFYNVIKKKSISGYMREVNNPNKSLQDGLKVPFMCSDCEELFSKYETFFSKDYYQDIVSNEGNCEIYTKNDNLRYFLLSIAWRVMRYIIESNNIELTNEEIDLVKNISENWRTMLIKEDMESIRNIQQFLIPTKELPFFKGIESRIWNNVGMDFKTLDKENEFEYSAVITQVPFLIMVTSVWGKTNSMKQFLIGKKIKPGCSELPKLLENTLDDHHNRRFFDALNNLSDAQKDTIQKRVRKNRKV